MKRSKSRRNATANIFLLVNTLLVFRILTFSPFLPDFTIVYTSQNKNTTQAKRYKSKKQQIMYIHVGPPKTATTTIQATLSQYRTKLLEDNIQFIGKDNKENWLKKFEHPAYCTMYLRYRENNQNVTNNCYQRMNNSLNEYYANGTNVIMSDEVIGAMFSSGGRNTERARFALKEWANLIQNWDVRIVLGYRPYFDFVLSSYNEQWEIKHGKAKLNKWPGHGGKALPLVKDTWSTSTGKASTMWSSTDVLVDIFSKHFDDITIFDITKPRDLMEHFLCDILNGTARKTCSEHRSYMASGVSETKKNVAAPLDYDMIATAASQRNLFDLSKKRRVVARKVKWHHEVNLGLKVTDLPLICPLMNHSMALLTASLAMEMKLFPDRDEQKLNDLFQERIKTKAFCNVDVVKVLNDDGWKQFFQSI